jgi:regulatory protein SWI5
VRKLKESVEAVYGPGSNVFINILPTPVATPQKRTSQAPMSQIDTVPIPLDFGAADALGLEPSNSTQSFDFHNSPEGSYYSPVGNSPAHSPWHSPVQQPMNSFMDPAPQLTFDDHPLLSHSHFSSSQTTLADVEPMYSPSHGGYSPDRSPRQMSIADLNLDATIEETGISAEEVAALIDHDTTTNTFRCLFEGCNKAGFQRRENVRSHVQTHLGDRPYKCIHCGKTFVRPHDLKRHAKIHSGVKPYQCPCGQEFVRQDALTRHRQRGSCSGAFPDAVPKTPARRGRPRKNRPEMDKRVDKAARTRRMNAERDYKNEDCSGNSSSSGGSGSDSESSPSPPPEAQTFDFGALDASGAMEPSKSHDHASDTQPFR